MQPLSHSALTFRNTRYELGGIFVTEIAPGSIAGDDGRIRVGHRVLEVAGRSVLHATQVQSPPPRPRPRFLTCDRPNLAPAARTHQLSEQPHSCPRVRHLNAKVDAAGLIRECTAQVSIVVQQVPEAQWREIQARSAADVAASLVTAAQTARQRGDPDAAAQAYHEALECPDLDPSLQCQALSGLGAISAARKQYDNAVRFHSQEADLCQRLGYIEVGARALNSVGLAYRAWGKWQQAISTYEREIETVQAVNDQVGLSRAWSNLGITHGSLKNFQRAVECHSKALSAANVTQDRAAAARAHSNLGISYVLPRSLQSSLSLAARPHVPPADPCLRQGILGH